MALNKAQTSMFAKIVIVVFGVILVIGLAGPSISGLLASLRSGDGSAETAGTGTLDAIAAEYQAGVTNLEAMLASDPTSSSVMIALGNAYFDWANRIQQAESAPPGSDRPYWNLASIYYERALGEGVIEPGVIVDSAIAQFYAGNTPVAIEKAERVMREAPDFAPAWFNAGIFYEQAGRASEALAAYRRYLDLDSGGTVGDPAFAQQRIADLEATVGGTIPATATP